MDLWGASDTPMMPIYYYLRPHYCEPLTRMQQGPIVVLQETPQSGGENCGYVGMWVCGGGYIDGGVSYCEEYSDILYSRNKGYLLLTCTLTIRWQL